MRLWPGRIIIEGNEGYHEDKNESNKDRNKKQFPSLWQAGQHMKYMRERKKLSEHGILPLFVAVAISLAGPEISRWPLRFI
jgi:hypothetical protein